MSINNSLSPVLLKEYDFILMKFPSRYWPKLRVYTFEELYYCYRLATHKMTHDKQGNIKKGDVFYLAMKRKLFAYLDGNLTEWKQSVKPISGMSFDALGGKWRHNYNVYIENIQAHRVEERIVQLEQDIKDVA